MWRARSGLALANGPECLEAVHLGHLQVHEDDIEIADLERSSGLQAVGGDDHRMAHPLEHADGHFLVDGMVLGQQDVQSDSPE